MDIEPKRLRYWREAKGMSQEKLGSLLGGISKVNVSMWEKGNKRVPPKYHDKIAEVLRCTKENLCVEAPSGMTTVSDESGGLSGINLSVLEGLDMKVDESGKLRVYTDNPLPYLLRALPGLPKDKLLAILNIVSNEIFKVGVAEAINLEHQDSKAKQK